MFWTMSLGQDDAIDPLKSCFKLIGHLLGQKSEIALPSQNPNFDHFALLMIWSNFLRNYGPKLIKWYIRVYNVDMDQKLWSLTANFHSWLFPQHNWFLGQLLNWLSKVWSKSWNLTWVILRVHDNPWKSYEALKVQLSLCNLKP